MKKPAVARLDLKPEDVLMLSQLAFGVLLRPPNSRLSQLEINLHAIDTTDTGDPYRKVSRHLCPLSPRAAAYLKDRGADMLHSTTLPP